MPYRHLTFFAIVEEFSWFVGWVRGWDLVGVDPVMWGCLASVWAPWPQCHFPKIVNMSFIRKLKHFTYIPYNKLIKFHPDFIINYV